jgi:hypothetical protein
VFGLRPPAPNPGSEGRDLGGSGGGLERLRIDAQFQKRPGQLAVDIFCDVYSLLGRLLSELEAFGLGNGPKPPVLNHRENHQQGDDREQAKALGAGPPGRGEGGRLHCHLVGPEM